jgi:hypothetical protein
LLATSVTVGVLVGSTGQAVRAREGLLHDALALDRVAGSAWLDARRPHWVSGSLREGAAQLARYRPAGIRRVVFQDFLSWDLGHVDDIAEMLEMSASA